MGKFIGEYSAKIDDKGRLVFPSALKAMAGKEVQSLQFVVKKDLFFPCLQMYAYHEWERQSEELRSKLNLFNREHNAFFRAYMSDRAVVEPDEKTGRILIPKHLLNMIGVKKEVVFAGNDFKIELWAKETYENNKLSQEDYIALAEKILS